MILDNLFRLLVPKDRKFLPLFEKSAANLVQITGILIQLLSAQNREKRSELAKEIERLEHVGDEITHQIYNELHASFITPFDREDVQTLASSLDEIVDYIFGTSKRMVLYQIETIIPDMLKLAQAIESSSQELQRAIIELKTMRNLHVIKDACLKINSQENYADDIFEHAVAGLLKEEHNAITVIKIKEILMTLETATDKCEDAANVLESILVKAS